MNAETGKPDTALARTHRGLARVWIDFETSLMTVPLVSRLHAGKWRRDDYLALLRNLRQQVVEGSRWISRAASNLGTNHEELRTLFIHHAEEEHRDYRMLEDNYVAAGGLREDIVGGEKNIGSEALSGYMYNAASQRDPVGMLGAMFVIEGLGNRIAGPWSKLMAEQLDLPPEATSFFTYHGENDEDHLEMFDRAMEIAVTSDAVGSDIIKHAKVVARLYRLQLEEIDNV
ncbi:iron-containing redox enzyme family protein [Pontixanthobacter luteolus]|uniref:iron-containing redox enzyme family protein n=1 Tax=Pontixanthobacter luteolus TaxID=295089 RepID=UPI002303F759|nr:iron-containing redox enzyme family protein [Pontixanthobacter luteolus]